MTNGNSFDQKSTGKIGHARKVWREIREVYPAGGTCSNVSDWVSAKLIPSGTPVVYDASANTFRALTTAQMTGEGVNFASLGINGVLQEDAVITDANTIATGTVVCDGDIYGFMLNEAVAAGLKALPSVNGYKIRVV